MAALPGVLETVAVLRTREIDRLVPCAPGTRTSDILGVSLDVPTFHHQSVLSHPGYSASAWASDGTLEAMEDPEATFRLAVQWHPEQGADPRLFDALIKAAGTRSR